MTGAFKVQEMAGKSWIVGAALVLLCILQICSEAGAESFLAKEKQVLDSLLLPSRYDPRVRPIGVNGTGLDPPTNVTVNLFMLSISDFDDVNMKFTVHMYFRQQWADPRLTFDDYGGKLPSLYLDDKSKIWTPDLFFPDEIAGHVHNILETNTYIRVQNGKVFTSSKLSLTLGCVMSMRQYPFDTQVCHIEIQSFSMRAKDLVLTWEKGTPARRSEALSGVARFSLENLLTETFLIQFVKGDDTRLYLRLFFSRYLTPSVLQAFLPSAILVGVSWLSFWLDSQAIVARVMIGVVTLIAAGAHALVIIRSKVSVCYLSSIDVWFGTCLMFVLSALLVSISANYKNRNDGNNAMPENADANKQSTKTARVHSDSADKSFVNYYHIWVGKLPTGPTRLDVFSRYLFPLGFGIFVIWYWANNLHSLNEQLQKIKNL